MTVAPLMMEKADRYLRATLLRETVIRFSRFYDGTEATSTLTRKGIGITEEDTRFYSIQSLIEDAVGILESRGWVERQNVSDKLPDGLQDYELRFTEKAHIAMRNGEEPDPFP